MICRFCQAAQLSLILNRHVQIHVYRIAHFLREGFSAQLRTPGEALLLYRIHMNKRCGHDPTLYRTYIITLDSALRPSRRHFSLVAQRDDRIDTHGPPRRQV